jgi:hypothetical protein
VAIEHVLAAVFSVLGIVIASMAVSHGDYWNLAATLGLGVLAYYCFIAGGN